MIHTFSAIQIIHHELKSRNIKKCLLVLILQFEFLVIKNFHVTTEYFYEKMDMQQSVHII